LHESPNCPAHADVEFAGADSSHCFGLQTPPLNVTALPFLLSSGLQIWLPTAEKPTSQEK
jgi:hypothetical protein